MPITFDGAVWSIIKLASYPFYSIWKYTNFLCYNQIKLFSVDGDKLQEKYRWEKADDEFCKNKHEYITKPWEKTAIYNIGETEAISIKMNIFDDIDKYYI